MGRRIVAAKRPQVICRTSLQFYRSVSFFFVALEFIVLDEHQLQLYVLLADFNPTHFPLGRSWHEFVPKKVVLVDSADESRSGGRTADFTNAFGILGYQGDMQLKMILWLVQEWDRIPIKM